MKLRTKFLQASLGALLVAWTVAASPVRAQDGCDDPTAHVEATPGPTPKPGPKNWTPDYPIGTVLDEDGRPATDEDGNVITDGHMTAPEDFTKPAAERVQPKIKVGKLLSCSAELASDPDKWTQADNDGNPCTEDPSGYEPDGTHCTWTCSDGQFVKVDTEGHITVIGQTFVGLNTLWQAPTSPGRCNIKCSSDDTPTAVHDPQTGNRDDDPLEYQCEVIVYNLSVRFITDKVAAGHVGTLAHQADVEVSASDGQHPVAGVAAEEPEVTGGGLGTDDTVVAKVSMTQTLTDADGKATGTFISGSRADLTGLNPEKTTITVHNTSAADDSSADITQVWNENIDGWSFPPGFDYEEPSTISYAMSYARNGKVEDITNHSIDFETSALKGWEWDDTGGEDGEGAYAYQTYSSEDEDLTGWANYESLTDWENVHEVTDADGKGTGTYTGDVTVSWDDDFIIDYVEVAVVDNTVYTNQ